MMVVLTNRNSWTAKIGGNMMETRESESELLAIRAPSKSTYESWQRTRPGPVRRWSPG